MSTPQSVTVTATTPRVTVRLGGSDDVPLRPSALLENITVGERLVVVQAANGGFYAIEREALYYASPHDHPYVNRGGDTMTGIFRQDRGGIGFHRVFHTDDGTRNFTILETQDDAGGVLQYVQYGPADSNRHEFRGDVRCRNALTVDGTKNAEIPDPDDPTVGYRFAAMEADEPGLLFKRIPVEITTADKVSKTVDLPPQWAKIAERPDAMVTPVGGEGTTQHDTRAWPRAEVDITVPNVTVYAPPGRYSVWVLACRKDPAGQNWQHVVAIDPEEGA